MHLCADDMARARTRGAAPRRRQARDARRGAAEAGPAHRRGTGRHPATSADRVRSRSPGVPFLRAAAELVRDAHERVDGLGYPNGSPASDVALGARIIAVADAFDTMTRPRVFRHAISASEALLGTGALRRHAVRRRRRDDLQEGGSDLTVEIWKCGNREIGSPDFPITRFPNFQIQSGQVPDFEPVIGLEIHAQLLTATKIFCGCSTRFGAEPNTALCPVCAGLPGALPVLNRRAVELATRAALALGCQVHAESIFARKNYFYPDLPKGYQISQYRPSARDRRRDRVRLGRPRGPRRHHPHPHGRGRRQVAA